ncbi:MAG: hypothetical protein J7K87_02410 [Candidatus Aenigmarchaeota archaeon]|nr:hypothetical protein [Candidatus Aenigmarchaeota archaeon]
MIDMTRRNLIGFSISIFIGLLVFLNLQSNALAAEWWNSTWYYRIPIEINSTSYDREDWPIEYNINFTSILENLNVSDDFDENSTRVFEYNSSGSLLYEVPSQFDEADNFNASNNAVGKVVFLMNGTTPSNTKRYYYIYFDTIDRQKQGASYPTNLSYFWNGKEFNVNNTYLSWYVDTSRGEDTSGLYEVVDYEGNDIFSIPGSNERTIEYMQYSNGTYNFSFDLNGSAIFKYVGPVRIVVEQVGNETIWNHTENITEGRIEKKYIFYRKKQWIVVEQNFTNEANYPITRNSTGAGALAMDVVRAGLAWTSSGNSTEPGSWQWFASTFASSHVGLINVNSSSIFWAADRNSTYERMGIELNSTTVQPNESIWDKAVLHFNSPASIGGTPSDTQVKDLRDRLLNPVIISQQSPERWSVITKTNTDHNTYNRGESAKMTVNVTYDPGDLVSYVNATLNMGTANTGDDETIILYDDGNPSHGDDVAGDKVFSNYFNFTSSYTTGVWNVTTRAYDSGGYLLNSSSASFNLTDEYFVNTTILNPSGLVGRVVNATILVKNYRQDEWIANASLNCSWDSTYVDNYTDYGNGTYSLSFTAPSYYGTFVLNCTAEKTGSHGWDTDIFSTEDVKTNISVNFTFAVNGFTAGNITLYQNQSFEAVVNATNIGNGTAYDANVTLSLLPRWSANSTFENLGNIYIGDSASKPFMITIPKATPPGNYVINATVKWKNPGETYNTSYGSLNVTVTSNPLVNIPEDFLSKFVPTGQTEVVGNFTVMSIGNDNITNVKFNVTGLNDMSFSFIPENISSLGMNSNRSVQISVFVPSNHPRGIFYGNLNVTTSNDGWDNLTLEIIVPETNMSIESEPKSFIADNITWYDYQNFTVVINTTNIGNVTAFDVNVTLNLPQYWISNYTNNKVFCGNVSAGDTCSKPFLISIKRTTPGDYQFNATTEWLNPGIGTNSNQTSINVAVESNPMISIDKSYIYGSAEHGKESTLGNFTLRSIGNDVVTGIEYNVYNLSDFSFEFISSPTILSAGENQTINVNVSVPLGYDPGNYTGILNVSSYNDGWDTLTLNVSVPISRTWTMNPKSKVQPTYQDEGKVTDVIIKNTGNSEINFTISPSEANHTYVNVTNFTIEKQGNYTFSVWWNVTGSPKGYYNSTYVVQAVQVASPQTQELKIYLEPYAHPSINISLQPNVTEEFGSLNIYANVTDLSGTGIAWATANVTSPSGRKYSEEMTLVGIYSNIYEYWIQYPDGWGNTTLPGQYTVEVYAEDGVNMMGNSTSSFYVYPKLITNLKTGWEDYFVGESGSIYYNVTDGVGEPLSANITLTMYDSQNNKRFEENYQTNSNGTLDLIPTFQVPSDAPLGQYKLSSFTTYYDDIGNILINDTCDYNFNVYERYSSEFETSVVWYPDNIMKFYLLLYTTNTIQEPDNITLEVFDPAQNLYLQADKSNFEIVNRTDTSVLYMYDYAMPSTTANGYYLSDISVWQGTRKTEHIKSFRVSSGGPYDVVISNYESEVPRGGSQNFTIFIENMGDVGQDVTLDYWVSDGNQTYASVTGEAVYVDSATNKSFQRSLPIYSDQPLGDYYLNVKMTYSNLQSSIQTNKTFKVVKSVTTTTTIPPTGPHGAPTVAPKKEVTAKGILSILNIMPDELMVERGGIRYIIIEIKNTGTTPLHNITSYFENISTEWFESIKEIQTLDPGSVGYLITKFEIPENMTRGVYFSNLKIISDEALVEQQYEIEVFESKKELLKARIEKTRELIKDLEEKAGVIGSEGIDVSNPLRLLEKATNMVDVSEKYLNEGKLLEATESLDDARNTLEDVNYQLSSLKAPKIVFVVPTWVYVFIVVVVATSLVTILIIRRSHIQNRMKLIKSIEKMKEEEKMGVSKHSDILDMIKSQYEDGLISRKTYEELKKKYEKE